MRTIKFRGKFVDGGFNPFGCQYAGGEWIYGLPDFIGEIEATIHDEKSQVISVYVDKKTIGQFTGLYDKNGKEIYEGDIVKLTCKEGEWTAVVEFGNPYGRYTWGFEFVNRKCNFNTDILLWAEMEDANVYCEVIGNIYDNPELFEEVELDE